MGGSSHRKLGDLETCGVTRRRLFSDRSHSMVAIRQCDYGSIKSQTCYTPKGGDLRMVPTFPHRDKVRVYQALLFCAEKALIKLVIPSIEYHKVSGVAQMTVSHTVLMVKGGF